MAVRWYTNVATDRFKAGRVYKFLLESSIAASVTAPLVEMVKHGRTLFVAGNQPGSDSAAGRVRTLVYWLPAPSVTDRADALGVLYATVRARTGATVIKAEAAQVTAGAWGRMYAEAGAHPGAPLSLSRFDELAAPTLAERAEESARGTAAHASSAAAAARDAASSAIDGATDSLDSLGDSARNTFMYTKVMLGLIGAAAFVFVLTGGKPERLLKG